MKVGKNFDNKKASDIFDKLKNVDGKIKPKRKGKFDNITHLMHEAQLLERDNKYDDAIKLYNQVIFSLPDSKKAYDALINIYHKQGDAGSEKDTLKKAILNCSENEEFKKKLSKMK